MRIQEQLPAQNIEFIEIPRPCAGEQVIRTSTVRQAIHDGRLEEIRDFLPRYLRILRRP